MFKIQRSLTVVILIVFAFSSKLIAVQSRTEFYPKGKVPKEYEEFCSDGDCTVLISEGWFDDDIVFITENDCLTRDGKKVVTSITIPPDNYSFVFIISSVGYTPGCSVTYTFKSAKWKFLEEKATLVPNRILVKSEKDTAQIEAVLAHAQPVSYDIQFTGFTEGEEVLLKSISYDEVLSSKFKIGQGVLNVMPAVLNKQGGLARLSVTRASGEVLKFELPWGWEWMKYCIYADKDGKGKAVVETAEFLNENPQIAEYFRSPR